MAAPQSKFANERATVLALGIVYASVALIADLKRSNPLALRGHYVLNYASRLNVVHWVTAGFLIVAALGGDALTRLVARLGGVFYLALAVYGFSARLSAGNLLGFHGKISWSYNLGHGITALALLIIGFAGERESRLGRRSHPASVR